MEYEKLIQAFTKQDQTAFTHIYDNYSSALYGVIYRMVEDEEKANDILQEAFIKSWKNSSKFNPEVARLYTCMHTICRNTAINYQKKKSEKLNILSIHGKEKMYDQAIQNFNPDVIDLELKVKGLDEK